MIVQTPVLALQLGSVDGMLNEIVSRSEATLAAAIASRKLPGPLSFVLVTGIVAAAAGGGAAKSNVAKTKDIADAYKENRRFRISTFVICINRSPSIPRRYVLEWCSFAKHHAENSFLNEILLLCTSG